MLSEKEIADLEKRYTKYTFKKRFKIFFYFFIFLFFLSSVAYYLLYADNTKTNIKKIKENKHKKETNITVLFQKADHNTSLKRKNISPIKSTKKILEEKSSIDKNSSKTYSNKSDKVKTKIILQDAFAFKIIPSNSFTIDQVNRKSLVFSCSEQNKLKKQDSKIEKNTNKNDTITDKKNRKPKIDIEMKDIDSIKYLTSKFKKTHDIIFALMLCENYYEQKDYKNSLKWSIIANDIDSSSERSWIWFAKSKYKLHQKEDAIKALKAFKQTDSSEKIKALLHDIINGELDD